MIDQDLLPFTIGVNAKTDDGSVMDYFATKSLKGFLQRQLQEKPRSLRLQKLLPG